VEHSRSATNNTRKNFEHGALLLEAVSNDALQLSNAAPITSNPAQPSRRSMKFDLAA
jgi:hypothetical protein